MAEHNIEQKYGLLLTISSQQDLGLELLSKDSKPISFLSIDEAVTAAQKHSKEPLLVKDWIYDIVPLTNNSYGEVIESYCSIPTFRRI